MKTQEHSYRQRADRRRTYLNSAIAYLSFLAIYQGQMGVGAQVVPSTLDTPSNEQTITLSSSYSFYDSDEFKGPGFAAMAVTPFCNSFTFLCHQRCLQRDYSSNIEGAQPGKGGGAETNRCTLQPNTNTLQVLCVCKNGIDLTAEIDYALEGIVDIAAAGGSGSGEGEAGNIHRIAYEKVTVTETVTIPAATKTKTKTVFKTTTEISWKTVTETAPCAPTLPPADGYDYYSKNSWRSSGFIPRPSRNREEEGDEEDEYDEMEDSSVAGADQDTHSWLRDLDTDSGYDEE
ncbi:hypothetical protein BGW38_005328 [Lunasporangiospora selenospora]|uniref:Uncharacterized protein n=1 Tax=Lunasporangiospora selenospora TaxID=979761 RepID=A0A9P6G0E7_9FUNG|nr:hypothetical protein BGW38_005328 [Lunasporangiospora selenospora]